VNGNIGVFPYPKWRKRAEDGYLFALGLKSVPPWKDSLKAERYVKGSVVYAILSMLDAQPGPKEGRVFRGWFFDLEKAYDSNISGRNGAGRVGQPHDRLYRDDNSDLRFLSDALVGGDDDAVHDFAVFVFLKLYNFISDQGDDPVPSWRRGSPWLEQKGS
jgi:hypothetical protein